jgi:hypothetical protein
MALRTDQRKAISSEVGGLQKRVAALKEAIAQQRQAIIMQCSQVDDALRCDSSHALLQHSMCTFSLWLYRRMLLCWAVSTAAAYWRAGSCMRSTLAAASWSMVEGSSRPDD